MGRTLAAGALGGPGLAITPVLEIAAQHAQVEVCRVAVLRKEIHLAPEMTQEVIAIFLLEEPVNTMKSRPT